MKTDTVKTLENNNIFNLKTQLREQEPAEQEPAEQVFVIDRKHDNTIKINNVDIEFVDKLCNNSSDDCDIIPIYKELSTNLSTNLLQEYVEDDIEKNINDSNKIIDDKIKTGGNFYNNIILVIILILIILLLCMWNNIKEYILYICSINRLNK